MMNKQAETGVLIGDAQTIDLADRKKGELPRLITRYPVRLPDGQEGAFELNGIGERYVGPPACIPYNGELTEFSDFEEGKALPPAEDIEGAAVCSRLTDADAIHRAGIHKVYILAGDPALAIADGYKTLMSESKLILLDTPERKRRGVMRLEDAVRTRLSRAVKIAYPGADYRTGRGAAGMSFEDILTAARTAETPLPGMVERMDSYEQYNRDETERLALRWRHTGDLLGGGLPRGQLTVIAAKEGVGKSTIAQQIIADAIQAPGGKHRALLYSGEKRLEEISEDITRMITGPQYIEEFYNRAGSRGYRVHQQAFYDVRDRIIGRTCFRLAPTSRDTYDTVQDAVEQMIVQHGTDIILIDNLMTITDKLAGGRDVFESQGRVARWLEEIAIRYNVWVILVCHVKKGTNTNSPDTDDISGSKDVTNAAGVVLSYNRYKSKDDEDEETTRLRSLRVLKNRICGDLSTKKTTDILTCDRASLRTYTNGANPDWVTRWARTYNGPKVTGNTGQTAEPVTPPRVILMYDDNSGLGPAVEDDIEFQHTIQDEFISYINMTGDGGANVYMQYTGTARDIDKEPVFLASTKDARDLKEIAEEWGIDYHAIGC